MAISTPISQVFYGWRKVTNEFMKRLDPDLLTHQHTHDFMKDRCLSSVSHHHDHAG